MHFKYEVDEKFITTGGIPSKIIGRHWDEEDGAFYWVAHENSNRLTWHQSDLEDWTKVKPFFEKDKTYAWIDGNPDYTFRVDEVRQVGGDFYAIARRLLRNKEKGLKLLLAHEFPCMTEV